MKTKIMHDNNNIHTKIIRLFIGEANPDEKKEVRVWLSRSKENQKLYKDLQEIWLASGIQGNNDQYNVEDAIRKFKEKIDTTPKKVRTLKIYALLKYAAVAVLLLAIPLFYYLGKSGSGNDDSFTTITCAFGDKSTVTLPDGSRAWLNSGSKLVFNNDFRSDTRMVYLEGEAYFSVKKNESVPFKVKASEIEVRVLGTEFNIKAYPDEGTISTTLVEGSIELKSNYQRAVMKPNQKAVYNYSDKKIKLYKLMDIAPETEWKEGRMVFRNESLEELELKLERWFDVDIVFTDQKVKERRFTGILERESILEVLTYFNYSEHVGYKINENEITFFSK